jgi:DNA-directed RNA polymerase specialized sigma24 family protein
MSGKLIDKQEEIVSAYVLQGKSLREIADSHGVSSGSVRTVLKKQGVTLRKRGRRTTQTVQVATFTPVVETVTETN